MLYNKERKLGQSLQIKIVFSLKVGAAPVGEALIDLFKKKAPTVKFREGWGMTELSPVVTSTRDDIFKPGSCGVLLPNTEAKIIDIESGDALGPHQQGELCIRGPQVSNCIIFLGSVKLFFERQRNKLITSGSFITLDNERLSEQSKSN